MGIHFVNSKIMILVALEDLELDGRKISKGEAFKRVGSSAVLLIERNKAVRFKDSEEKGEAAPKKAATPASSDEKPRKKRKYTKRKKKVTKNG